MTISIMKQFLSYSIISIIMFGFFTTSCAQNLRKTHRNAINQGLKRQASLTSNILTKEKMAHLPKIVQQYLEFTGSVGQPVPVNMRVRFQGQIRSHPQDSWMNLKADQYSFFDQPTRSFYIRARKMGLPVKGLHLYQQQKAFMNIQLLGLFTIVDLSGPEMDQSETVTMLNDMCLMAPGCLISERIQWQVLDSLRVRATYTHGNQRVSAELLFNDDGRLLNFFSDDRYERVGNKQVLHRWSTPVNAYGKMGELYLPVDADACYHRPDTTYSYAHFVLQSVVHNVAH